MKTSDCGDYGKSASVSTGNCPDCDTVRGDNLFRFDENNDKRVMAALSAGSTIGLIYGIVTASGPTAAIFGGLAYAILGILVAAPIAFAINLLCTRYK